MAEPRVPLLVKGDYTDTAFTTWRFMIRCSCWMSATLVSKTFLSSSSLQLFCLKNCSLTSFFLSFSSTVDYCVHKLSRTDYFIIIILLKKCVNISTCLKICIPIINQFQFEPILGYKWIELEILIRSIAVKWIIKLHIVNIFRWSQLFFTQKRNRYITKS